jgi:predicted GNAT family acetyltransferase
LLVEARKSGALQAYLQVDSDNSAARTAYFRLGFTDGYSYHYLARDPTVA